MNVLPSYQPTAIESLIDASNFSQSQTVRKNVVQSEGGLVSAQHKLAASAGAMILKQGGNAVDAAITTAFMLGVVEPWMSGPGGGGAMVIHNAATDEKRVIDFNMRSPAGLDLSAYPLVDGIARDLFPWPRVSNDLNLVGPKSIAIPGMVDGMGLAHDRFGKLSWSELLEPAIAMAQAGPRMDWYTTLMTAACVPDLSADPVASKVFLRDGMVPAAPWTALSSDRLDLSQMAETLKLIAREGPRSFYEGSLARRMAKDVQSAGGFLSIDDLENYRAKELDPLRVQHGNATVWLTPELTSGSTFAVARSLLNETGTFAAGRSAPNETDFVQIAKALRSAQDARLAQMGDVEGGRTQTCTTSFAVVDKDGNMVTVTQTLLSIFGSKVMLPGSGLLMNNGILWFNPEQGHPNSLGPGKRCLTNICPLIGKTGDQLFGLGASGGRKIMSAVFQLTSFLTDFGMTLEQALHHPRIDCSTPECLVADDTLPPAVTSELKKHFEVTSAKRSVYPYAFGCPSGVLRKGTENQGVTEIMSPWGDTIDEFAIRYDA